MKRNIQVGIASALMSIFMFCPPTSADESSTRLIEAIEQNDKSSVNKLIAQGASINGLGRSPQAVDLMTPLTAACSKGNPELIEILISRGADIDGGGDGGPLKVAAQNPGLLRLLLKKGANPNAGMKGGWTPLFSAILVASTQNIRMLLDAGASVEPTESGNTALIQATERNRPDIADMLIQRGAGVDVADGSGMTPLMHAANNGANRMVWFLLAHGASLKVKDAGGRTPLLIAAYGRADVMRPLLAKGANPNEIGEYGRSALMIASLEGNEEVVDLLLKHQADPNLKDKFGTTAVSFARDPKIIRALNKAIKREGSK